MLGLLGLWRENVFKYVSASVKSMDLQLLHHQLCRRWLQSLRSKTSRKPMEDAESELQEMKEEKKRLKLRIEERKRKLRDLQEDDKKMKRQRRSIEHLGRGWWTDFCAGAKSCYFCQRLFDRWSMAYTSSCWGVSGGWEKATVGNSEMVLVAPTIFCCPLCRLYVSLHTYW